MCLGCLADVRAHGRGMSKLDTLMDHRDFGDPKLRAVLDEMTIGELVVAVGESDHKMTVYEDAGWSAGDGRPAYGNEDPAVMVALSRCASNRVRFGPDDLTSWAHPEPCGWCDVPLEELLAAARWAIWSSRSITVDVDVWKGTGGSSYERATGTGGPQAPTYRDFDRLPVFDQAARVQAAVVASRG